MDIKIETVLRIINVDCTVRARSTVDGGTKQLKLRNRTKGEAPWDRKLNKAFRRVKKKIRKRHQANIMKAWAKLKESKMLKKQKTLIGDGMVRRLLSLGLAKHEITSLIGVGGPRLNRIKDALNGVEVVKEGRRRTIDASREDVQRMISHIFSLDIEQGYPCQHQKLPLYVVGYHQGSTKAQLHADYAKQFKQNGWRVFSCNRYREYVKHHLPRIKLNKTNTDMCNQCFSILLQLKNPNITGDEKDELKEQLTKHLKEANTQRRAMNTFVAGLKKAKAPEDPPLKF